MGGNLKKSLPIAWVLSLVLFLGPCPWLASITSQVAGHPLASCFCFTHQSNHLVLKLHDCSFQLEILSMHLSERIHEHINPLAVFCDIGFWKWYNETFFAELERGLHRRQDLKRQPRPLSNATSQKKEIWIDLVSKEVKSSSHVSSRGRFWSRNVCVGLFFLRGLKFAGLFAGLDIRSWNRRRSWSLVRILGPGDDNLA